MVLFWVVHIPLALLSKSTLWSVTSASERFGVVLREPRHFGSKGRDPYCPCSWALEQGQPQASPFSPAWHSWEIGFLLSTKRLFIYCLPQGANLSHPICPPLHREPYALIQFCAHSWQPGSKRQELQRKTGHWLWLSPTGRRGAVLWILCCWSSANVNQLDSAGISGNELIQAIYSFFLFTYCILMTARHKNTGLRTLDTKALYP